MKKYGFLTLRILLALLFLMAGWSKLSGDPKMIGAFSAIGIGQWFRFLTGGIELAAAIGLLFDRWAGLAALLLTFTMIGAVISHIMILGGSFLLPLILFVLNAAIVYERWQARKVAS